MTVANRSLDRGQALAEQIGGRSMRLADLPSRIAEFDIIISCTASALPIIGLGMIERAIKARLHKPVFIVDLAVPRDVEEEVARLDDVYVYTVDDLGQVVQSGKAERMAAVAESMAIIDKRVEEFSDWMQLRRAVPTMQMLQERAMNLGKNDIRRAKRAIQSGADLDETLERLAHDIARKMLHDNMMLLKNKTLSTSEREHVESCLKRFYLERKH